MVPIKSIEKSHNLDIVYPYSKKSVFFKKEINVFIIYIYIIAAVAICVILPSEYFSTSLYYIAIILISVMFASMAENSRSSFGFEIFLALSFFVLFFNLGFRNFSGIDDDSYIRIFNGVLQNGWFSWFKVTTMEPGYLLLNSLVSLFTDNYLYMQLTSSFIPLFLFYHGFKRYRKIISLPTAVFLLCTFIYFQVLSVAIIRMFIAMGIVFNALDYIPQRKTNRYIFLILVASMFHYSALFMLVLTYLAINKDNLTKRARKFLIIGFFAIPVIFTLVAKYFVPLLGSRYSEYGTVGSLSFGLSNFDTIPPLLLLLIYLKKFNDKNVNYFKIFLAIFALSCILSFYSSMVSLGRLIFYANLGFFLAASMVSKALKYDSKKILFHSVIVIYGFLYVYRTQFILDEHIPNLFPYQNIFFSA